LSRFGATANFLSEKQGISNATRRRIHGASKHPAMDKFTLYLKESYQELMQHVSWPTMQQLQESTLVVLVTSGILALVIFLMDVLSSVVFKSIYGVF
jgi:preprotein translocase subunit SecE